MKPVLGAGRAIDADPARQPDVTALVEQLCHPIIYPDHPRQVSLVETHISWVFLTDRFAYKLKKPVKYQFLDFSTVAQRHKFCLQEIALNRRLAPQVYLEVLKLTANSAGQLRIGGDGTAVDWLVRMRRLPADRALDQLIGTKNLKDAEIRQLAETLAEFYRNLPPLPLQTAVYRQRIEDHVQANRNELLSPFHELDATLVKRVHAAQIRLLRIHPETFDNRVRDGRLVEGHGDLRPEHIYFNPAPNIIDCIEFNAEFRQVDVLDELSFLAVECSALGAENIGSQVLDHYLKSSGDRPPPELLPFYMSYRASVRAKIHALRARQTTANRDAGIDAARNYLVLADRYSSALGPPLLLVIRGLSGTGKSTVAAALAKSLGLERLQTDSIRRELFGANAHAGNYNQLLYRPEKRQLVYDEIFARAEALLKAGESVIVDGTFLTAALRANAAAIARRHQGMPIFVECVCPLEVAESRIASRLAAGQSQSEARPEFTMHQQAEQEPDPPNSATLQLDTRACIPELLDRVFNHVRAMTATHPTATSP